MRRLSWAARTSVALIAWPAIGLAQTGPAEVVVVAPSPLHGAEIEADKLPGTVERLSEADFARQGSLSVSEALSQRTPSASLADAQGNPFGKTFDFRGFDASPLQGATEGLAVYMDGVRLNESFGDTINWDLIPETAVRRAELFTSNPAFGLNALGGAVNLTMKTGADSPGGAFSVEGGSFGRAFASAEYGAARGPWSIYLAADGGHEEGWRRHSPSSVARAYGDIGWTGQGGEAHLVMSGGQNILGVVGPTPVDLLDLDRRATYTSPQTTRNQVALVALNGRQTLGGGWSVQADLYARGFQQRHIDGNDGNFERCSGDPANPLFATLCVADDDFPAAIVPAAAAFQVLGPGGAAIDCPPLLVGQTNRCDGVPYGTVDRTDTRSTTFGGAIQATGEAPLFGHANLFTAGLSYDQGQARFSASSELGLIFPDLHVGPDGTTPGAGQIIHTAGDIDYSPVEVRTTNRYVGLYVSDTFDLTRRLSVTLSGRANLARVTMADLTGVSPELNGAHRYDRFNPAAGLSWRMTPKVTVYGGYAEANRAPTALELGCSDPTRPCLLENALVADPPLKQVVAHSFEGGLRGRTALAGGRLGWRLGVYRTDSDDDIIALASVVQGRGSYTNVPATRRQGVEAKLDYAAQGWSAYAAYGYVDATYRFSGALPSPNSPFADDGGDVQVRRGDHIGGIPSQRFKAGVEGQLWRRLTLGGDLFGVGRQFYVGDEANQDRRLPAYWSLGLHAEYRLAARLTLFTRVENLLDQRYATYGTYFGTDGLANLTPSPLPEDADPHTQTPAAPRSVIVGLKARW